MKNIGLIGADFTNILRAHFLYKSALRSFSLLYFGFVICWQKNIGKKSARKMLMKLTPDLRHFDEVNVQFFFELNFFKNKDNICRISDKTIFDVDVDKRCSVDKMNYDRDFLLSLRDSPLAQEKPRGLENCACIRSSKLSPEDQPKMLKKGWIQKPVLIRNSGIPRGKYPTE